MIVVWTHQSRYSKVVVGTTEEPRDAAVYLASHMTTTAERLPINKTVLYLASEMTTTAERLPINKTVLYLASEMTATAERLPINNTATKHTIGCSV